MNQSKSQKVGVNDLFIDSKQNSKVVLGKGSSATVYLAISRTNK